MKRLAPLLALAIFGLGLWTWPTPARGAPPPTPGDCVRIAVWSNGVHTSLSVPAEIFPHDHPLRRFEPEAAYFLVGWGDEAFYRASDAGVVLGVRAMIPPSPTVVHVIAADTPVETFYRPSRMQHAALSHAQAAGLAAFLARSIETDAAGAPVELAPGHTGEHSAFLRARGHFHAFNVCNHWTARALRAAGLEVGSRLSFRADGVLNDLADSAPAACPQ